MQVQIMSGKEKGKRGVILKVYREDQVLFVPCFSTHKNSILSSLMRVIDF